MKSFAGIHSQVHKMVYVSLQGFTAADLGY